MTISINQQVDYLWKKLGYNVAKTEMPSIKDATNESILSSPFIPGDKIWSQSGEIPTILPSATSAIVGVYTDALTTTVACTMDITATPNRTWLTGLTDWIPATFGSTYQIKVYLAPAGSPNPQTVGHQLYAAGSNNSDEWFFDYESGVLNFIGDNLPNQIFTGKILYISGARYIGLKGVSSYASGTFGNITITGETVSSTSNLILDPVGNIFVAGATIGNVGYPTLATDVATVQYVIDNLGAVQANMIYKNDSSVSVIDSGMGGEIRVAVDGTQIASYNSTTAYIANLTVSGTTITSKPGADLILSPSVGSVITTTALTAMKLPTGTTLERPLLPEMGQIRFNSTSGIIEVYDGGSWVSAQAQISTQIIDSGNGVQTTFTLDRESYASNLLVTINGVVQTPSISYIVSGNQITFGEPLLSNEVAEIRFISQSVSAQTTIASVAVIDTGAVSVSPVEVTLDAFGASQYRSAKYTIQVTADGQSQLSEILVVNNGVDDAQLFVTSTPWTGSSLATMTYQVALVTGICSLKATCSTAAIVKIQKSYLTP